MGSYPLQMFGQASSLSSLFGSGSGSGSGVSTGANSQWVRPPLMATRRHRQRGGGKRSQKTRKQRGGFFSPTVMGPFLKNVEALAAPLSIYLGYKMYKGLKGKKGTRRA